MRYDTQLADTRMKSCSHLAVIYRAIGYGLNESVIRWKKSAFSPRPRSLQPVSGISMYGTNLYLTPVLVIGFTNKPTLESSAEPNPHICAGQ